MNKWVPDKQRLGFRENSMLYTFKCDRHTELEVIYFYNCIEFIILYSLWNILIWIPLHNENQRPWTFLSKAYFVFTRITISYYIYMHQHIEAGAKWHFSDILKCIFVNENVLYSSKISLTFAPKCPINNFPALMQIMAWHWPGDKPLSEPMLTELCVTRPQWVS